MLMRQLSSVVLVVLAMSLNAFSAFDRVRAADATATALSSGVWTDDAIWDSTLHPDNGNGGLTYDAVIGGSFVSIPALTDIEIESLILSSGRLSGQGSISLNAASTWSGGQISGDGGGLTIGGPAELAITGGTNIDSPVISGHVINRAKMIWLDPTVVMWPGSELINGGLLELQGDGTFVSGAPTLTNQNGGVITRDIGTGVVQIGGSISNDGLLDIRTGTLQLDQGESSSSGEIRVSDGAELHLPSTTLLLGDGATIGGDGVVNVQQGTLRASDSSTADVDNVLLTGSNGILGGGSGTLNVHGQLNVYGGRLGNGLVLTESSQTTLEVGPAVQFGPYFEGHVTNAGEFVLLDKSLQAYPGVTGHTFTNTGTFDVRIDTGGTSNFLLDNNSSSTFVNAAGAMLKRDTSDHFAWTDMRIDNEGTIDVSSGGLQLRHPAEGGGLYRASNDATLDMSGTASPTNGTWIANSGKIVMGQGVSYIGQDAVVVLDGVLSEFTGLTGQSATVTSIDGRLEVDHGAAAYLSAEGLNIQGIVEARNGARLLLGDDVSNSGEIVVQDASQLLAASIHRNGRIVNNGLLRGTGYVEWVDAAGGVIRNEGGLHLGRLTISDPNHVLDSTLPMTIDWLHANAPNSVTILPDQLSVSLIDIDEGEVVLPEAATLHAVSDTIRIDGPWDFTLNGLVQGGVIAEESARVKGNGTIANDLLLRSASLSTDDSFNVLGNLTSEETVGAAIPSRVAGDLDIGGMATIRNQLIFSGGRLEATEGVLLESPGHLNGSGPIADNIVEADVTSEGGQLFNVTLTKDLSLTNSGVHGSRLVGSDVQGTVTVLGDSTIQGPFVSIDGDLDMVGGETTIAAGTEVTVGGSVQVNDGASLVLRDQSEIVSTEIQINKGAEFTIDGNIQGGQLSQEAGSTIFITGGSTAELDGYSLFSNGFGGVGGGGGGMARVGFEVAVAVIGIMTAENNCDPNHSSNHDGCDRTDNRTTFSSGISIQVGFLDVDSGTIGGTLGDEIDDEFLVEALKGDLEVEIPMTLDNTQVPMAGQILVDAGESPGNVTFSHESTDALVWALGENGTGPEPPVNMLFEVNDATGTAGDDPGWDLIHVSEGGLTLDTSVGNDFVIQIDSLGLDNLPGVPANFDPNQPYSWTFIDTALGFFGDDLSTIDFQIDASQFATINGVTESQFSVIQDTPTSLAIAYAPTPVPEPSSILLAMVAIVVLGRLRTRSR